MSGISGFGLGMATPEKMAEVQDRMAERDRARRVKEANLAAYDAAREADRNRRGGSVFSYTPRESVGEPDGIAGTVSNTVFGPQTGNMPVRFEWDVLDSQARIGSEFADLARRSAAVRQHNDRIGVDSISAAMRSARSNGGRLPQNLVDMLSRNLGLDGKTSAVYGAGYLANGDFDIDIVTRGANGGLQRTTKKITPLEQYNMMLASPGIWGEDGVAVSQGLYNRLRNTRGKSELQAPSVYEDNLRAYNTQMQAQTSQKDMLSAMKMLMDYEQKSKAPMSAEQFLRMMPKSVLEMAFPPRYEEGSDPNDPERPTKPYTPQEIAARTNELMSELRNRASGNGEEQNDALRNTLIAGVRKMMGLDAPPVPDDVAAFQQRQRERQMRQVEEAQAREDITRRQQQLINYFKDGKWYSGNGYIRDGKVYDGQGYEIEGATPAEMVRGNDGGVVSNERGWFSRALPSARELVGGGAGGGNPGEGAAQGSQAGTEQPETQQAQQPAQGTQGAQQTAAQGSTASATSDIDAKKRQLATMEAELKRRQSVGKMVDDIVSEQNAALDGPRVGKSTGNDFAPIGYGGINVNTDLNNIPRNEKEIDESLRQKELATVKEISSRGGEVWHDEDSRLHARIGNFEYLPRDEQEKYRDGIVSGLPLDVIRDIQRRAYVAAKNVAESREKNLAMLRSKARGMFQTEAERVKYVSDEDKKWRRKNDPGYKDAYSASNTEKTAEANLFAFFP